MGAKMYGSNTYSISGRDITFQSILHNAAENLQSRIRKYDENSDPIARNRLKLLYDIVSLEIEKVESGMADTYSGLGGPMKAVRDWGEPEDSDLMAALRDAEGFYRQNYWRDEARDNRAFH
jgi:hypothetical protein